MSESELIHRSYAKLSIGFTDHSLCARCGTCAGVCPVSAIDFDEQFYPRLNHERCIECGLCARTCPGAHVGFSDLNQAVFNRKEPAPGFDGYVRQTWVGQATDDGIRSGGASGGVVTALLWDLLKNGVVDGCVATRMNRKEPWRSEPFIARSYSDLLDSQGSRYTIIPINQMLAEIRNTVGRYAIAALPCQVHGIRMAIQSIPDLAMKIALIIGLFCGGSLEPYAITELLEARKINKNKLARFEFRGGDWPGRIRAIMQDGETKNLHYSNYKDGAYIYLISLYMPQRCQTCVDGSNEFSDLSVGDAWTRDNQGNYKSRSCSKILVRTAQGEKALLEARERGSIQAQSVTLDPSYRTHKIQTQRKGIAAPLRIERWRRKGLPVPDYDRPLPQTTLKESFSERIVTGCLYLGRFYWIRFPAIKLLTSYGAMPLIALRVWIKNRKYRNSNQ